MFDADMIGKEWRTQEKFGSAYPLCRCGGMALGVLADRSETERADIERNNGEAVEYPHTCPRCHGATLAPLKRAWDADRPRWKNFRGKQGGKAYAAYIYRARCQMWIDAKREQKNRFKGGQAEGSPSLTAPISPA
jgi:hypothetical protein